jgi:hypothetical protein
MRDQSSQPKASQASRSPYFWPLIAVIAVVSACLWILFCYVSGTALFNWISVNNSRW